MAERVERKIIVVLGAGVVGLTTAVRLQEQGKYDVTIIAEVFPEDPKTIKYTSQWAGANYVVNDTDEASKQLQIDLDTLKVAWELANPKSPTAEYIMRIPQTEFFGDEDFHPLLRFMPDHEAVPQDELPPGITHGSRMNSISFDTPKYLQYLSSRFTEKGGRFLRATVQHIQQIVEGGINLFSGEGTPTPPDAVVVCTGLWSRFLGGVEDKDVYPIRGQTVLIRAPWIKFALARTDKDSLTYIIPRKSGDIVLGGTLEENDWYPRPRPETTRAILERNIKLCPELAPPKIREKREPTVDDLLPLVIADGCGLRPARKGGIRLEVEWFEARNGGTKVPVVYNYGHGGYGFQASWGSADVVVDLLKAALKGDTDFVRELEKTRTE